jgi:multidrug efflux system membrane fusion protein
MGRKTALAAAGAIGIMVLGVWYATEEAPSAGAAQPKPPTAVPVTVTDVTSADVPVYVVGTGSIQAYNTVLIKPRVDGQITEVQFEEGQEVKKGDPLFQIDPRPFQAALDQAEAQLAAAQLDLERFSKLMGSGFQTRQSYDQQKATVAQLQAALRGDQAAIENAEVNLGYTQIRSPIDGRTGARLVDVGNVVHAADTGGLVTVTQLRPIFASFTVPQRELDAIRRQQSAGPLAAKVFAEDDNQLLGEGKLSLIDNQVDQTTGTVRLKAVFDNADERLWPGEFVAVRLVVDTRRNATTVPVRTVQQGANGYYAYVVKPDGTAERRDVELVAQQDGIAVIGKGLAPGEKVVLDGQYRLSNGDRVRLEPAQQAEAGK